jgi:hypothetical protein
MPALLGQTISSSHLREGKTGKWLSIMQSLFASDEARVEIYIIYV